MPTDDFFRARIDQMIDLSHPLAVLAGRMPWESLEKALAPAFAHKDRKGRSDRATICSGRRWRWREQASALPGVHGLRFV